MNLEFLTEQDWSDFEAAHPYAAAFLGARAVRNEVRALVKLERSGKVTMSESDKKRLVEARMIFGEEAVTKMAETA